MKTRSKSELRIIGNKILALFYFDLGNELFEKNDFNVKNSEFTAAIKLNPNFAEVL